LNSYINLIKYRVIYLNDPISSGLRVIKLSITPTIKSSNQNAVFTGKDVPIGCSSSMRYKICARKFHDR